MLGKPGGKGGILKKLKAFVDCDQCGTRVANPNKQEVVTCPKCNRHFRTDLDGHEARALAILLVQAGDKIQVRGTFHNVVTVAGVYHYPDTPGGHIVGISAGPAANRFTFSGTPQELAEEIEFAFDETDFVEGEPAISFYHNTFGQIIEVDEGMIKTGRAAMKNGNGGLDYWNTAKPVRHYFEPVAVGAILEVLPDFLKGHFDLIDLPNPSTLGLTVQGPKSNFNQVLPPDEFTPLEVGEYIPKGARVGVLPSGRAGVCKPEDRPLGVAAESFEKGSFAAFPINPDFHNEFFLLKKYPKLLPARPVVWNEYAHFGSPAKTLKRLIEQIETEGAEKPFVPKGPVDFQASELIRYDSKQAAQAMREAMKLAAVNHRETAKALDGFLKPVKVPEQRIKQEFDEEPPGYHYERSPWDMGQKHTDAYLYAHFHEWLKDLYNKLSSYSEPTPDDRMKRICRQQMKALTRAYQALGKSRRSSVEKNWLRAYPRFQLWGFELKHLNNLEPF